MKGHSHTNRDLGERIKAAQSKYWRACEDAAIAYESFVDGKATFLEVEASTVVRDSAWIDWKTLFHAGERLLAELRGAE